jgi:hypothetical protein
MVTSELNKYILLFISYPHGVLLLAYIASTPVDIRGKMARA